MSPAQNYFLSCDWGTSSFRICLADRTSGALLERQTSAEGIAATYDNWKRQGSADRIGFFLEVIRQQLRNVSASASCPLEGVPVIISGMASSSIGIQELPYAEIPFSLSGAGVITRKIAASATFKNDIILVSGVRSDTDVMRGEETQLLGLAPSFPKEATFIFPGTHSKHIHVRGGYITGFETYMTGELFHLLSAHSILKGSIDRSSPGMTEPAALDAFYSGLRRAETTDLLRSAFLVRTNYLFGKMDKASNFHYLSGLLIGAELRHLKPERSAPGLRSSIVLCGGQVFSDLYYHALSALGLAEVVHRVAPERVEQAALNGHRRLLDRL